jgi:hypothetical protein
MEKKKVLFIGIGFYDYEVSIKQEFKKLDYEVDYFSEVRTADFKSRFYSLIKNEDKINSLKKRHVINIAESCSSNYDLIFIIKCECLSISALELIKNKNPKAKYILYLWDSIVRIPNIETKFSFFDKVYSFDRLDCVSHSVIQFLPLFYRNEYIKSFSDKEDLEYGIYHIGWCHSDRLKLVKIIAKYCDEVGIRYRILLFTTYFSYLRQLISGGELKGNRNFLTFKTISAKANFLNIKKSNATLDIAHPLQSGLTMRTIELVGMQKKIITTNKDIVNYDFYHPNNVLIIDRENPIIDKTFLDSKFNLLSDEIVLKYNISIWLKSIISG